MFCISCGRELDGNFAFCPECGTKVFNSDTESTATNKEQKKRCPTCGELMPDDMFYCLSCGHRFQEKKSSENDDFSSVVQRVKMTEGTWRNKWVSLALCILLGWLGIHKFYEKKMFSGVLYLFTLGLFGVGWIVDIVIIAFKPNPYRAK